MLSIVIPVLNEAESLPRLLEELDHVAHAQGYALDLIFIDDGSTDASWQWIAATARSDRRVRGIRFRRNFGKAAALSAGFAAVRGDLVFTMDADLQDDPHEMPKFLAAIDRGFDVVSGWKKKRHDPWHKVLPSRVFNWLVSRVTGVKLHDHNCGFKCYRRDVFRDVKLYGELHRFVPVLAAAKGWRVGEVVVHHRPRTHGTSKYGWIRIPKGFLDLLTVKFLTGYGQRPQHMLGMTGLIAFTTGMLGILVLSVLWVLSRQFDAWPDVHLTERAIFFYCLGAALLGAQMMSIGFLAELMTAYLGNESDNYSVAERVGSEAIGGQGPEPTGRRISAGQIRTEPAVGSVGVPHLKKQPSHEPSQTDDGNAADLS